MGIVRKTFITTDDTQKEYIFDGTPQKKQLWAVEIRVDALSSIGHYCCANRTIHTFFVERDILERLGALPYVDTLVPETPQQKRDEVRDALELLLSLIGVYPQEGA